MDWSLLGCGRGGHLTYAPDEPDLRRRMRADTPAGEAWRCLRCGSYVPGSPHGSGPAEAAPQVRRGKELRSAVILRVFAVERYLRALVVGAAAYGVWRFSYSRTSLQQTFRHALPAVRTLYQDLGFSFNHSKIIGLVRHALHLNRSTLDYLAIGLAAYAVIELVEGTGLWLLKRWGEYFAAVATSVFLPYEIYDLASKVTVLRVLTFLINLALVVYLVISKRLFGVRGGRKAYEARLREDALLEVEAVAQGKGRGEPPGAADHPAPAAAETAAGPAAPEGRTGTADQEPPPVPADHEAAAGEDRPARRFANRGKRDLTTLADEPGFHPQCHLRDTAANRTAVPSQR